MRTKNAVATVALSLILAGSAAAQMGASSPAPSSGASATKGMDPERAARDRCATLSPVDRGACLRELKEAAKAAKSGGNEVKGKAASGDAKVYNDAVAAANAKATTKDFVGAAEVWRTTIVANPQNKVLHRMHAGLAISLRQQAIAAYRADPQPTYPPPGATNDQIRAANAANLALENQKRAVAVPLLKQALGEAVKAATLAEAQEDRGGDPAISVELRENAQLIYALDRPGVIAAPRDSIDVEVKWLRKWLAENPTLAEALVSKYGFPVAASLTIKDPTAGLALADELKARTKADPEGLIGYAELVSTAKLPATDPRRAQALAAIVAAEPTVGDASLATRLRKAKTALSAKP